MIFVRFFVPLALALFLIAYLLLPVTNRMFIGWAETGLEARAKLVFSSIEDDLPDLLSKDHPSELIKRFTRLAQDETLIGVGYCEAAGAPKYRNNDLPDGVICPNPATLTEPRFQKLLMKGMHVMVASFPVDPDSVPSHRPAVLMIAHDMSYAERRSESTQRYALSFILGVSLLAAFITMIVARLTLSRWVVDLRTYLQTGERSRSLPRETLIITREMQQRIRQMEREAQRPLSSGLQWSAAALSLFVKDNLPSEQLLAVSYREPYVHAQTAKGIAWTMPPSGLVTAIEPIMRACSGTWVAVATGDADHIVADEQGVIAVPPDHPSYRLKRLWLSESEMEGFYMGFANQGVWPLCNIAYVKPRFRAMDWEAYQAVNQKFADAILAEAKSSAPVVFIQDYHFALLPKLIREKLPDALIVLFWHIPWPNSETFGILPWRREFLEGMLAADIVGFHTQFHCNNFLDCVDSYVEALIDREHNNIKRGSDLCMIRPYPISIAWPDFGTMEVPDVEACRQWLASRFKIDPALKIVFGVERLDYVKGISERLRSFGIFLENNPEWRGKASFFQIASPSRSVIPAYAEIGREIEEIADEINRKFGRAAWQPVHILKQNFSQSEVYKCYRAADVCVVSSLHDGMNLVAKEYIAARDDERGALILSQFAGSSRELIDALIVNPYDEQGLSQSFLRALAMGEEEQRLRMKSMREYVKSHNVYAWAAEILSDAANLHRRRQLNNMLLQVNESSNATAVTEIYKEKAVSWPTDPSRSNSRP